MNIGTGRYWTDDIAVPHRTGNAGPRLVPGWPQEAMGEERPARCCDLHNAHCYDIEEICCHGRPGVDGSITNPHRPAPSVPANERDVQ